jgi:hypothetical protein
MITAAHPTATRPLARWALACALSCVPRPAPAAAGATADAGGVPLGQALQRAGYAATEAAGLRIEGARDEAALERVLEARLCSRLASGSLSEAGAWRSGATERVTRGGYAWTIAGENPALGRMTAREAVDGWLASPRHCANIMEPRFTETGVALAAGRERDRPTYWVQTFAAPQLR